MEINLVTKEVKRPLDFKDDLSINEESKDEVEADVYDHASDIDLLSSSDKNS